MKVRKMNMNNKEMNILVTIPPNNILYLKTMLLSLFENNNNILINIFLLHSFIPEKDIRDLNKFVLKYQNKLFVYRVDEEIFKFAPLYRNCSVEIYYRLAAMKYLPQNIDKVLYLDVDIIINKSLLELYNMEFNDKYFIVCEDTNHSKKNKEVYDILNIPYEYPYFNSGVMVMNLKLLRENNQYERILKFMHGDWLIKNKYFHDQNILNALFFKDVRLCR